MIKIFAKEKKSNKITIKIFGIGVFSYYIDYNNKIMLKKMLRDISVGFQSWFILNKAKRKEFRRNKNSIFIKNPDTKNRSQPVEPWAFIRVKNEIITLDASLNSILPAIQKGIIAFNDYDDGSGEYIMEFCKLHPGFKPLKYPYCVYSLNDPQNLKKGNEECKIHEYYNAALSLIPKDEWFIKIDTDQIYDATKLKKIFYLPRDENDAVILTRLNLHYDGNELYFIKNCPYLATPDHWLIYNNNLSFELKEVKNSCSVVEHLNISAYNLIYPEMNNYHFPIIKKYKEKVSYSNLVEFNEFINSGALAKFIEEQRLPAIIDPKMLDKEYIMNICKKFNMKSEKILPKKQK